MIGRFGITARGWARYGATLLLFALLVAAPSIGSAKPYETQPGPMPEGDPTADDQPSPTPKKSARFGGGSTVTPEAAGPASSIRRGRITWELYLRILSRLAIR